MVVKKSNWVASRFFESEDEAVYDLEERIFFWAIQASTHFGFIIESFKQ